MSTTPQFLFKDDGVTHLNIYSKSKVLLGRQLSHFYHAPFTHPEYGYFTCMEGFWHYVSSGFLYPGLRNMAAYRIKQFSKTLKKVPIDNFMEIIKDGNRHKLLAHQEIIVGLVQNTLPLDHYYVFGPEEIQRRAKEADDLIAMFDSLKAEFIETQPWRII